MLNNFLASIEYRTVDIINTNDWIFNSNMEFGDFILMAISLVVLFAWIFSIWFILWGGVLLILSWGKDEKIKPAYNSIRYSLIWLFLIVISIFVFPKIAALLGLDVSEYLMPDRIFDTIKELWDKILWTTSTPSTTWIYEIDALPDWFINDL